MLNIGTGIDNGNTGAGTGVTSQVGGRGTGLLAGGGHIRVYTALIFDHARLIASLNQDFFNTLDGLDGLDVTILDVGRNNVSSQSQVPHHVQFGINRIGNGRSDGNLLGLQLAAISHSRSIHGDVLRVIASLDGAGLFQNNGYTDHIGISVYRSVLLQFHRLSVRDLSGNCTVVNLFQSDRRCLRNTHCCCREGEAQTQRNDHYQRKQTLTEVFLHWDSSFLDIFC